MMNTTHYYHNETNKECESTIISSKVSANKQKAHNGNADSVQQNGSSNNFDKLNIGLSSSDRAKKAAAIACGEAEVKNGMRLGIGSGTTVKFLIDWLKYKRDENQLEDIQCVSTSFQTHCWLKEARIPVYGLDELVDLDIAIDGADEVDFELNCIKGGGGCLLQEKIVQTCSKRFVLIGEFDKYSSAFGKIAQSIPIEISPLSYAPVQRWIMEKHGGKCVLRMDVRNCFPVITENHNYLIDWYFPKPIPDDINWNDLNQDLLCTPGVFETGLFIGVAKAAYFATSDGDIHFVKPKM